MSGNSSFKHSRKHWSCCIGINEYCETWLASFFPHCLGSWLQLDQLETSDRAHEKIYSWERQTDFTTNWEIIKFVHSPKIFIAVVLKDAWPKWHIYLRNREHTSYQKAADKYGKWCIYKVKAIDYYIYVVFISRTFFLQELLWVELIDFVRVYHVTDYRIDLHGDYSFDTETPVFVAKCAQSTNWLYNITQCCGMWFA